MDAGGAEEAEPQSKRQRTEGEEEEAEAESRGGPRCRAAGTARGGLPRCTSAVEWVRDVFFYMAPRRPKRDARATTNTEQVEAGDGRSWPCSRRLASAVAMTSCVRPRDGGRELSRSVSGACAEGSRQGVA